MSRAYRAVGVNGYHGSWTESKEKALAQLQKHKEEIFEDDVVDVTDYVRLQSLDLSFLSDDEELEEILVQREYLKTIEEHTVILDDEGFIFWEKEYFIE